MVKLPQLITEYRYLNAILFSFSIFSLQFHYCVKYIVYITLSLFEIVALNRDIAEQCPSEIIMIKLAGAKFH